MFDFLASMCFQDCKGDLVRTLETCARSSGLVAESNSTEASWYVNAAAKMAASLGRSSQYHLNSHHRNNISNNRQLAKHDR